MNVSIQEMLKKYSWNIVVYLIIFCFGLGLRVYYLGEKDRINRDEFASWKISTSQSYDKMPEGIYHGVEYDIEMLKEAYLRYDQSFSDVITDLAKLRKYSSDSPHTNFYYSLVRIANIGNNTLDWAEFSRRVGILNYVLYSLTFVLLICLFHEFFGNNLLLVSTGLIISALNTGSISATIFLRPYALQELMFVAYALGFAKFFKVLYNGVFTASRKWLYLFSLLIALTLLSSYSSIVFVFLSLVVLALVMWNKETDATHPLFFVDLIVVAGLITNVLYQSYLWGFLDYRGREAVKKLGISEIVDNIIKSLEGVISCVSQAIFYLPIIIMILGVVVWYFVKERKCKITLANISANKLAILALAAISTLWMLMFMYLAPYKSMRYVGACFPILALLVPLIVSVIKNKVARGVLFTIIVATYSYCAISPERKSATEGYALSSIEHVKVNSIATFSDFKVPVAEHYITVNIRKLILYILPDNSKVAFNYDNNLTPSTLSEAKEGTVLFFKNDYENGILPRYLELLSDANFVMVDSVPLHFNVYQKQSPNCE